MNKIILILLSCICISTQTFGQSIVLRNGVSFNQSTIETESTQLINQVKSTGNNIKSFYEIGYTHKVYERLKTGLSFSQLIQGGDFEFNNANIVDKYKYVQINHLLSFDILKYKKINFILNWKNSFNKQIQLTGIPSFIHQNINFEESKVKAYPENLKIVNNNFMTYNFGLSIIFKQPLYSIGISAERILNTKPVVEYTSRPGYEGKTINIENISYLLFIETKIYLFRNK